MVLNKSLIGVGGRRGTLHLMRGDLPFFPPSPFINKILTVYANYIFILKLVE